MTLLKLHFQIKEIILSFLLLCSLHYVTADGVVEFSRTCPGHYTHWASSWPNETGIWTCENGGISATSRCSLVCTHPHYENPYVDYLIMGCYVVYSSMTRQIVDAQWYGLIPYCTHFTCRVPMVDGYGNPYICDGETVSRTIPGVGEEKNYGYNLDTMCYIPCPNHPTSYNTIQCQSRGYPYELYLQKEEEYGNWARGVWNVIQEECIYDPCPDMYPMVVYQGMHLTYSCTKGNQLLSECSYACQSSKELSHTDLIVCKRDETGASVWNGTVPTCIDTDMGCEELTADGDGERGYECTDRFRRNSVCNILCNTFSYPKGPPKIICEKRILSYRWKALDPLYGYMMPRCEEIECPDPKEFTDGNFEFCDNEEHSTKLQTNCFYACPRGTRTQDNKKIRLRCSHTVQQHYEYLTDFRGFFAQWIVEEYPCKVATCQDPREETFSSGMTVICFGNKYGDQCAFYCPEGSILDTDKRWSICDDSYATQSTFWKPSIPTCIPTPSPPPNPVPGDQTYIPVATAEITKKYLGFQEKLTWEGAKAYCEAIWGDLAMPKNVLIHDLLVELISEMLLPGDPDQGVWIGMNDKETESEWKFLDGTEVSKSAEFFDLTWRGRLPNPAANTSAGGEWFFVWTADFFCNQSECKAVCEKLGGKMANIVSQEMNDAVAKILKDIYDVWHNAGGALELPYMMGNWFIDIVGDPSDMSKFTQGDGQRVYLFDDWYGRHNLPIPHNREDFAPFQNWQQHSDPEGFYNGEHCVAIQDNKYWIDTLCQRKQPPLCEFGQFPFERWANRGSKKAEPNDLWKMEDCGGYLANLHPEPAWNDFDCMRSMPFICEVDVHCPNVQGLSDETQFNCYFSEAEGNPQCQFSCEYGYELDQAYDKSNCVDPDGDFDGVWDPPPPNCVKMLVVCEKVSPEDLSFVTNFVCTDLHNLDSVCTFSCQDHYVLTTDHNVITCLNPDDDIVGEWDLPIPNCLEVKCPAVYPEALSFATNFVCTADDNRDSVCTFSCSDRYELVTEHNVITCVDPDKDLVGEWDLPIPDCADYSCSTMESLIVGETQVTCTDNVYHGSSCTLSCPDTKWLDNGMESTVITCHKGSWDIEPPRCKDILCPDLSTIVSSVTVTTCTNENIKNSHCEISCPEGMTLDENTGFPSVVCEDNDGDGEGEWSQTAGSCEGI